MALAVSLLLMNFGLVLVLVLCISHVGSRRR